MMAGMVFWSLSHFFHFHTFLCLLPGAVLQRKVIATRMMNLCVCFLHYVHALSSIKPFFPSIPFIEL